jgi:signal transduction histidine kinase
MPAPPAQPYDRDVAGLAATVTSRTTRLSSWLSGLPPRRRERVEDGTLAVALAVVNVASLLPYHAQVQHFWLALFLVIAQALPLTWRRSWPITMTGLMGIPRFIYDLLSVGYAPLPLPSAIGFATIMERSPRLGRWITAIAALIVIAVSQAFPGHNEPYDGIIAVLTFAAAWAVGTLSRARRAALAAQERRADAAEARADERAARAAAAERMRIARELHDVVAHHVSLVAVQAEAAASLLPGRPAEAAGSVDLIGQTARQAMTELRRLLGVLRDAEGSNSQDPSPQRSPLTPAPSLSRLGDVLAQVRSAGMPVEFRASGPAPALSPSIDLTAFRIVQEALTNSMRHAPGTTVRVEIAYEEAHLTIRVLDTGPGLGPALAGAGSLANGAGARGYGLAGIAERVASCGGTLAVGPREAGGFSVTARLPMR